MAHNGVAMLASWRARPSRLVRATRLPILLGEGLLRLLLLVLLLRIPLIFAVFLFWSQRGGWPETALGLCPSVVNWPNLARSYNTLRLQRNRPDGLKKERRCVCVIEKMVMKKLWKDARAWLEEITHARFSINVSTPCQVYQSTQLADNSVVFNFFHIIH